MKHSASDTFPYDQFPVKLIHKDGKDLNDTKVCYFQNQDHANKYIVRSKFKSNQYEIFVKPGSDVADMGKSTRRKSTPKRSSRRSSSNN